MRAGKVRLNRICQALLIMARNTGTGFKDISSTDNNYASVNKQILILRPVPIASQDISSDAM